MTETVFLRFSSQDYQQRKLVWRAVDVRCECCRNCRRRIVWADRLRRFHFLLFVLCTVLLLGLYVFCVPLLLKIGVQKALVGVGFVVPGILAWLLTGSIVKASAKDLLSDRAVQRLRIAKVSWRQGPQSYMAFTVEPDAGFVDFCHEEGDGAQEIEFLHR